MVPSADLIDDVGFKFYSSKRKIKFFASFEGLDPCEESILKICADNIVGKSVLQIGIGGGRLCAALAEKADNYVGVDFIPDFVDICSDKFPHLDFKWCDARDLSMFEDDSFDFITFNGMADFKEEERKVVVEQVKRVLKKGGQYCFSSHNLDFAEHIRYFDFYSKDLKSLTIGNIKNVLSYLVAARHEYKTPTYSVISDPKGGFGSTSYHIRHKDQLKVLEGYGLKNPFAVSFKGDVLSPDIPDTKSAWIYYVSEIDK